MKIFFSLSRIFALTAFLAMNIEGLSAQRSWESVISDSLTAISNRYTTVGKISASINVNKKLQLILVNAPDKMSYMPFRPENVQSIYQAIEKSLPASFTGYRVECRTDSKLIEDLIPNFFRTKLPDSGRWFTVKAPQFPLLRNLSKPFSIESGLANKHIALWQSHGKYYDQKQVRWVWQRPRLLETVEDLFTQSYVLPYLVPMLENAGANVLIPRERDTQLHEIIVDNDTVTSSRYREHSDRKPWRKGSEPGFANPRKYYIEGENPFYMGSYRESQTINDPYETSFAEWFPNFPEAGRYAVYISYKSLENSVSDARYTVVHRGVRTEFAVNQQMNGGTWLYLGHFYFDKGRNNQNKVVLSNYSSSEGKTVTADAVKFGGGMGNIARYSTIPSETKNDSLVNTDEVHGFSSEPMVSNYPRYTEGARYWLQWAGAPDSVYSRTQGKNDYSDDFQSRGFWVNYLSGGSSVNPNHKGLNLPVDMAFAFHSDAGTTDNDSIIGTLGICSVPNTAGKTVFENTVSRWASRDLTDIVMTQIVDDVRKLHAPEWTRRGLWNKSYSESRVPEVPTMLLELLSHQNFADMRYGLDPRFRFTVSRSIYKGMLKFLADNNQLKYVVQPLPVEGFSCKFIDKNKIELRWTAVSDPLEPTAQANRFVLYTRIDDGDFDNGILIDSNRAEVSVQPGKIYSFKVTAVNDGGQSFPSETLSACRAMNEKGVALIVNGFTRVSAAQSFTDSTLAGFYNDKDAGVPYMSDISFVGKQIEFRRKALYRNEEAPGFGACNSDFESVVVSGNTFDFPYIHGKSLRECGYSFVSSSLKSVETAETDMTLYPVVDLILGEQKQTSIGNGKNKPEFKTFPLALQQAIRSYCKEGGNLLLSGSYIASDLFEGLQSTKDDRLFSEQVLKYRLRAPQASVGGQVRINCIPYKQFRNIELQYNIQAGEKLYSVESPDGLEPVGQGSVVLGRYNDSNTCAAVAYAGAYKVCAFGFPLESIPTEADRNKIFGSVIQFFSTKISNK